MEEGIDLGTLDIGSSEGFTMREGSNSPQQKKPSRYLNWKKLPKKCVLNLNKYIAKYDFEIARKLSGVAYKQVT